MTLPPGKSRKSVRLRLARAELLLALAVTAQRWATQETGLSSPDLFEKLAERYDLTAADLTRVLTSIGGQLERQAERAGYADTWDRPE